MSMTVFLNEILSGAENRDRLVAYQPSANPSLQVGSWIDMVVAIKGRYSDPPDGSLVERFDKFMFHITFGKSDKVCPPGFEANQGSLEDLELRVERAKWLGLTDLHSWISVVDPDSYTSSEEELGLGLDRCRRALLLIGQAESMCERLGGELTFWSHPAGLLKIELRSDAYQNLVSILRTPPAK
ncbi:hypothetical protein KVR01_012903 [Diaporthe batatas]|uniref:uncharacterized protein n=1 Tax=Diaporthe batatas TaxID=748121 RepID=UPI001D03CDD1|nr:uncharacterized protein KVR01_012903 [Diaporthe batatas]KAG8157195.1 hypothetical protein KVR01_012903 [Diaporthe batatas]